MRLIMSTGLAWSAKYCNEEGQVLFRSESPGLGLTGQVIKLFRVVPPSFDNRAEAVGDAELRDFFEIVGEIDYRLFTNSNITYQGACHPTNMFFKKGRLGSGGRDRIFRGPDGNEYIWKLTTRSCKLILKDPSKTPIATFHDKQIGLVLDRDAAYLEIFPAGMRMVGLILMTFIYVEKLRGDREGVRSSHDKTGIARDGIHHDAMVDNVKFKPYQHCEST